MFSTPTFGGFITGPRESGWAVALLIAFLTGAQASSAHSLRDDAGAPDTSGPDTSLQTKAGFAPYCGLYSLHTAMRSLGNEVPFAELLRPEYISSHFGSSMQDLIQAAKDHGMYAEPMGRMTNAMLREADCPVILHVKPELSATKYNHWVLFMGTEGDRARIHDGKETSLEPTALLSARWDGTGLLISNRPIDSGPMLMAAVNQFLSFAVVAVAALLLLHYLRARQKPGPVRSWGRAVIRSAVQAACIVVLALLAGSAFRALSPEGYLSQPEAVAGIQNFYKAKFLPTIKMDEIASLPSRADVAIVDARKAPAFEAGHLPGAINIDPDASEEMVARAMRDVPKDRRVIVYCQLLGCPYSEIIAQRLMTVGYSNLVLYRGGWDEWKGSHHAN